MEEKIKTGHRRPKISTKRTKEQQQYDMRFCSELFLRGHTYRDVAIALNKHNQERGLDYELSHVNVFRDIKLALIEWKRARLENIDDYINAELQKLDRLEREAWDAWEASKGGKLRKKSRDSKKPKKLNAESDERDYYGYSEEATETSAGNPKFLDLLLNVQQRRAKLLGFDAPSKIDLSGTIDRETGDKPKYNVADIPKDLLFDLADKLQNAAAARIVASKGLPN